MNFINDLQSIKTANDFLDNFHYKMNHEIYVQGRENMDYLTREKIKKTTSYLITTENYIAIYPNSNIDDCDNVIIYIHGGGWLYDCFGFYHDILCEIAHKTNSMIYYIKYPLAPENKYPTAINFCREMISDVIRKFPKQKIYMAGDSAGGNLVLNLIDEFENKIEKYILICPVVGNENITNMRDTKILDLDSMQMYFKNYGEFEKIIPRTNNKILLFLAENDILCEQGKELHGNLNNCECYVYNGGFHNFMFFDYEMHYKNHFLTNFINFLF
jgi:acetyl esterase/lipase